MNFSRNDLPACFKNQDVLFNFKKSRRNISNSVKVFIFAAGVTSYTIIKKTFR
jgi:hypothetical protein